MRENILFELDAKEKKQTQMHLFLEALEKKTQQSFKTYEEAYVFSVKNPEIFWGFLFEFAHFEYVTEPKNILSYKNIWDAKWFEGCTLNFAQNLLSFFLKHPKDIAITSFFEDSKKNEITGENLISQVRAFSAFLRERGVQKGDRVAAVLGNTPEAIVGMLATTSLGAVWSSCSPDFGEKAILDRFLQIEPKVLLMIGHYQYGGKVFDSAQKLESLAQKLPGIETVVKIGEWKKEESLHLNVFQVHESDIYVEKYLNQPLAFTPVQFMDPVYILFSSGTTGVPKCITHSVGGVLLQHFKELALHTNLKAKEKLLYFTTTGWMMWNWSVSALMLGVNVVVMDGSPSYPLLDRLWKVVDQEKIDVFGTSAKFLSVCRKTKLNLTKHAFKSLKCILSTGSPLMDPDFEWVYENIKKEVLLCSISGGTDIVSCFVLGNPLLPITKGEIQCRGLGMDVQVWSEAGTPVFNEVGELVCTTPAPSMPIYFWGDPDKKKYKEAYFEHFKNVWRHGDFMKLTSRGTAVIYGRSDQTLNRAGVRIGTAEIYSAMEGIEEVADSVVVALPQEEDQLMVMTVVMKKGHRLEAALEKKIKQNLKIQNSPRHVPDKIFEVSAIPYTLSGKKVEKAVQSVLMGKKVDQIESLMNPECLSEYEKISKKF